jgi:hypothetical protein
VSEATAGGQTRQCSGYSSIWGGWIRGSKQQPTEGLVRTSASRSQCAGNITYVKLFYVAGLFPCFHCYSILVGSAAFPCTKSFDVAERSRASSSMDGPNESSAQDTARSSNEEKKEVTMELAGRLAGRRRHIFVQAPFEKVGIFCPPFGFALLCPVYSVDAGDLPSKSTSTLILTSSDSGDTARGGPPASSRGGFVVAMLGAGTAAVRQDQASLMGLTSTRFGSNDPTGERANDA